MKHLMALLALATAAVLPVLAADDGGDADTSNDRWNTYRRQFEQTQPSLVATGAGRCANNICHGGAKVLPGDVFQGDEWTKWRDNGNGVHFKAYKLLREDRSVLMAKLLYGPDAVAKERRECLDCHAHYVDNEWRGRSYDLEDGVTCESCHGRAEQWIGPHVYSKSWRDRNSQEKRTADGYYDTRDLMRRTEKCLECHLGTASKRVTHEMMAAGHPPLTFELVHDSDRVPKHWKDNQCFLTPDEGSFFHARAWAVGQLVTFRESMNRLVDWTSRGDHDNYALFDCYACHHDINNNAWRQRRAAQGPLGEPPFDLSAWAMCRPLIELHAPGEWREFERLVGSLVRNCAPRAGNASAARDAAARLASMADDLAQEMSVQRFDEASVRALLRRITKERQSIADLGFRTATQALFSANALYCRALPTARCDPPHLDDAATAIAALHDHLFDKQEREKPADFDPEVVRSQLKALEDGLALVP